MVGKKSPATRLTEAHAALRETNRKIAELDAAKVAALLADRDEQAVQCGAKAQDLRQLAAVQNEKIRLIEVERDRAENQRREDEKESKIARIEKTLTERNQVGAELQAVITKADGLFRKLLELGRAIDAAWPWPGSDRLALMFAA